MKKHFHVFGLLKIYSAFFPALLLVGCLDTPQNAIDENIKPPDASFLEEKTLIHPGEESEALGKAGPAGVLRASKSRLEFKNGIISKSFDINVPVTGEYFLGAWIDGLQDQAFSISIDGVREKEAVFRLSKGGWQTSVASAKSTEGNRKLGLEAGQHVISLSRMSTAVPNVDAVLLSSMESEVHFPDDEYNQYLQSLKAQSQPVSKGAMFLSKSGAVADDPLITYPWRMGSNLFYSYWISVYLTAGTPVTYETSNASANCDPVLHLFMTSNPGAYSWTNDDGAGVPNSRISITPPVTGWYTLYVRAISSVTTIAGIGTVDIKMNGAAWQTNCPVAGRSIDMSASSLSGTVNIFTAYAESPLDPLLFLLSKTTGNVIAYNDDYAGTGAFTWGANSRIKGSYGSENNLLMSAYSYLMSSHPNGVVSVITKIPNGVANSAFPNLNADDNLKSAPASTVYNCIAWAGGVTSYWAWPPSPGNPWYVAGNPLQSFHNFFSNTCAAGGTCKRYAESNVEKYGNYSSSDVGSVIALWYNATDGVYTHASVRQPAHNFPHGFDWESKPGQIERKFHERNSLVGTAHLQYGTIVGYYQRVGYTAKVSADYAASQPITEEESILAGKSVLQEPQFFDESEVAKLKLLKQKMPEQEKSIFNALLRNWKATLKNPSLAIHSNPSMYRNSEDYRLFEEFCVKYPNEVKPFLLEELNSRDPIVGDALVKLLVPGNEKVLDAEVEAWAKNQEGPDGKFVVFSPENIRIRFAKKLLEKY